MSANGKILPEDFDQTIQSLSRAIEMYEWGRGLAHDMRSPLSAVIGYLDMIRRRMGESSPHQLLRYAELAHEAALRVNQMVQDVLDVTNIDHNGLPIQRQEVAVQELFRRVANAFSGLAEGKQIRLSFRIEEEPSGPLWADAKQLQRVFDNLVGNAIKFTPAGGCVMIRARWTPERYCFEVADTGRGIPGDIQCRLFEDFQQVLPEDRCRGYGLGLALVKCIVRAHQGEIHLDSEIGAGSRFTFWVPHRPPSTPAVPLLGEFHTTGQMPLFRSDEMTIVS